MDRKVLEHFLKRNIQLVNDENFVKNGEITHIFDSSIAFFTDGRTIYLSFDRIKEIRPLGGTQ